MKELPLLEPCGQVLKLAGGSYDFITLVFLKAEPVSTF